MGFNAGKLLVCRIKEHKLGTVPALRHGMDMARMLQGFSGDLRCCAQYTNEIQYSANVEMERLLNEALGTVRDLLQRNRAALDAIVRALTAQGAGTLTGEARRPWGPQFLGKGRGAQCYGDKGLSRAAGRH